MFRRPTFIKRQITALQGTDEWHLIRKKWITATDVTCAKSNKNFLDRKFKESVFSDDSIKAMRHGTLLEPISKQIFNDIYNTTVIDCGLIKHKTLQIAASPDGYFYIKNNKTPSLIEIKNPYTRVINHLIPYGYWIQMQIQMFVTELYNCIYFETSINFNKNGLQKMQRSMNILVNAKENY